MAALRLDVSSGSFLVAGNRHFAGANRTRPAPDASWGIAGCLSIGCIATELHDRMAGPRRAAGATAKCARASHECLIDALNRLKQTMGNSDGQADALSCRPLPLLDRALDAGGGGRAVRRSSVEPAARRE